MNGSSWDRDAPRQIDIARTPRLAEIKRMRALIAEADRSPRPSVPAEKVGARLRLRYRELEKQRQNAKSG